MLTLQNNEHRWILANIVESGNRQFWGWHELFFVTFFWLLFFLRTWNQNLFFFCFHSGKFSSAAPTIKLADLVWKCTSDEGHERSKLNVFSFLPHSSSNIYSNMRQLP